MAKPSPHGSGSELANPSSRLSVNVDYVYKNLYWPLPLPRCLQPETEYQQRPTTETAGVRLVSTPVPAVHNKCAEVPGCTVVGTNISEGIDST